MAHPSLPTPTSLLPPQPSYAHPGANPYERETGRSGGPAGTYAADGTFQTPRTPSQAEELHALSRLAQDAATFLWELIATSGGDLTTLDTEMQVSCAELDDKIEQLAGQIRGLVGDFDPSSSQRGEAVLAGALEALDTLQNVRTEFDDLTSIHGHTPTAAAAATRAQPPLPVSTPTGGGRVRLGGRNANWEPPGSTTNNNNNNNIIAERDVVVTPAPLPAPLPPPPPPSVKPKAKPKVIEGDLLDMSDPTPAPAPAVTGYPMGHAGYYAPPGQQVTGAGYVGGAPVPLPGPAYGVPAPQMTGGGYGYGSTTAMVPAVAPGMMPTGSNPSMATGGVLNTNKSKPQRVGYPAVSPGAAAYYVPPSATTTGGGSGHPPHPWRCRRLGSVAIRPPGVERAPGRRGRGVRVRRSCRGRQGCRRPWRTVRRSGRGVDRPRPRWWRRRRLRSRWGGRAPGDRVGRREATYSTCSRDDGEKRERERERRERRTL